MVGFTSFSERSGEEAAYTLMRSLSKLMDEAVQEQGGIDQSFTGDGIMCLVRLLLLRTRHSERAVLR
jgi:class 3 adenylate cyclase